jgi:hypothetical protein
MEIYKLNIKQIGGYKFNPGDRFITISGDYGTIIRVAQINEFGTDLAFNIIYYVVNFDNGNRRAYSEAINISSVDGTYNYIINEQSLIQTTQPMMNIINTISSISQITESPNNIDINKCKFFIGEYIYVQNSLLRLINPFRDELIINPFRDELIINKFGRITKKHNLSQFTIPPYKCLYEIIFDDGKIAP